MKNAKILIETLETCGTLMQKCAQALAEYSQTVAEYEETLAKYQKSEKEMFDLIEKQQSYNNTLQQKLDRILSGAIENARTSDIH